MFIIIFIGILGSLLVIFALLYHFKKTELEELKYAHEKLCFSHKSNLVKHGKSFEQLFPYMENYPYYAGNFRFIGSPIDGLSFEDEKVVFVEFKTGKSVLSPKQKKIKKLIEEKKVVWKEIRD
tara:strand:+ start:631 stop:999 length:369 start_codon:yes stop_codon:yes gene_type:complete